MEKTKNILVICGPTASGKTSLALSVANDLPESLILSVDSRQIYQGLDIVTGKDIPTNLPKNISIRGVDITSPDKNYNLSDFVDYSQGVIRDSLDKCLPLIIVGGTGLYLKAITSNFLSVGVAPNPALRSELETLTVEQLQQLLFKKNPEKLQSLNNSDINNPRRLIRAIEISRSNNQLNRPALPDHLNFLWIGLNVDKEQIKKNIHQRVVARLNSGAVEEVTRLLVDYPDSTLPIFSSLGVRDILSFIKNEITFQELVTLWTNSEVDYARRQMVWFKKQTAIIWYDKDSIDSNLIHTLSGKIKC